jgi:hypothetical protein
MSGSAIAVLDLPVHELDLDFSPLREHSVNFQSNLDIEKLLPDIPSLLRLANSRFLMDRVDTNKMPDWDTLKNITFDHDIFTAINMISFDTVTGFKIGGKDKAPHLIGQLDGLDEDIDLSEIYRNVVFDELRYGNAFVRKLVRGKVAYSCEIIRPQLVVDMELSPFNKPMWWVFQTPTTTLGGWSENVAYVDPKYLKEFESSGHGGRVVGTADEIVHFKGSAPIYQKWGVGISQVAKILIEAKVDMLVDFSKIIKKEAGTREIIYVDVKGLNPQQRTTKINNTMTEMTEQRKRGSVIVLGKKGSDDVLDVKYVGSEGKVLDNFSMHYRDDILRAIRILTRLPPSFWLGEATNKATINTQLVVYNRFLKSIRWFTNKRFIRQIFVPLLRGARFNVTVRTSPEIMFSAVAIEDPMDRAIIDKIAVETGVKSRRQVAEENHYELPEAAGEVFPIPKGGGGMAADMIIRDRMAEGLGVGTDVEITR